MKPSQGVLFLLQRNGLMAMNQSACSIILRAAKMTLIPDRGQLQITSSGFQFLLHTPHAQLWELLLQYLQMVEVRVVVRILSCRLIN
jgi:transcription initiation factor TFIIH subunit 4